ncbi:hypothetical protein OIO90_001641 [Microbotryomycetes sp. JL221]|nr:hypothetical protein OIO90_001641 [Microbotryomycetes sp. JL221]
MNAATRRVPLKAAKLSNTLSSIKTGPSARALPSYIQALKVEGLTSKKPTAIHFVRRVLSRVHLANEEVPITVTRTTATDKQKASAGPVGIEFTLADSSKKPFMPLRGTVKELEPMFWSTVEDRAKLESLQEKSTAQSVSESTEAAKSDSTSA